MSDRYTKIILTIIALALVANVAQHALTAANAQSAASTNKPCGSVLSPCFTAMVTLNQHGNLEFCDLSKPCLTVYVASK